MGIESCYNYRKISEKVTTSGVIPEHVLVSLREEGYETVINLLPKNHKKAVPEEKKIIEAQRISYLSIPVEFDDPKLEELDQFMTELQKIGDKKIHIHCAANWRVSAFYGIYAFQSGLWSKNEATNFISSIWNPAEFPAWSKFLNHFGLRL